MTKLALVSAGLSQPSSSRLLADRIGESFQHQGIAAGIDTEIVTIDLRQLAQDITNNLLTGFPSEKLRRSINGLVVADAMVAVTPVFSASYSGLFKSFFDVLEPGILEGKAAVIGATGGSARHSLVLDYALRPLMSYLRVNVMPTGVFAATADFGATGNSRSAVGAVSVPEPGRSAAQSDRMLVDSGGSTSDGDRTLADRIDRAAGELLAQVTASPRPPVSDPFDLPLSFEELLAR